MAYSVNENFDFKETPLLIWWGFSLPPIEDAIRDQLCERRHLLHAYLPIRNSHTGLRCLLLVTLV